VIIQVIASISGAATADARTCSPGGEGQQVVVPKKLFKRFLHFSPFILVFAKN
jgi:hypothetical protein